LPRSSESLSDLLDQVNIFDALSSEDRRDLENQANDITFLAGDTIVGESEKGDNFYILIHGTAAVLKLDEEGSHQQVTEFKDGDIIGESSLLEQEKGRHRRSASIVARTACHLVSIPRNAMVKIVENYPDIRQQLQEIHDQRINAVVQPG
jgi:CRP-like cAMP-binding protein